MHEQDYRIINIRLMEYINKQYQGKFWSALFFDEQFMLYFSSNVSKQDAKVVMKDPDDWDFIVTECGKFYKNIMNAGSA